MTGWNESDANCKQLQAIYYMFCFMIIDYK